VSPKKVPRDGLAIETKQHWQKYDPGMSRPDAGKGAP